MTENNSQKWDPHLSSFMNLLISKNGVPLRTISEAGTQKVRVIRGKDILSFLQKPSTPGIVLKKCPGLISEHCRGSFPDSSEMIERMLSKLVRCDFIRQCADVSLKATVGVSKDASTTEEVEKAETYEIESKEENTESNHPILEKKKKWPTAVRTMRPFPREFAPKGLYIINYSTSSRMTNFLFGFLVVAVLVACLFPVWPYWARVLVWYIVFSISLAFLVLVVIRLFLYLCVWCGGSSFWLFPNLLDDDLGVIDSFRPLYSFETREDKLFAFVCRGALAVMMVAAFYQLSITHSLADITSFTRSQLGDIIEWGEKKVMFENLSSSQRFPSLAQVDKLTIGEGDNNLDIKDQEVFEESGDFIILRDEENTQDLNKEI